MRSVFPGRCGATNAGGVRLRTGDRPKPARGAGSKPSHQSEPERHAKRARASMARQNRQKSGAGGTSAARAGRQQSRRAGPRRRPASREPAKPKNIDTKNVNDERMRLSQGGWVGT